MKRLLVAASSLLALTMVLGCNSKAPPAAANRAKAVAVADSPSVKSTPAVLKGPATEPMPGYVLIAPLRSTETYLLDQDGKVVHSWSSKYPPAASVYLLENGDLLRCARDPDFKHFRGGGIGGILERYNWEGELIWTFQYANEDHCAHHDIEPLPNGNILMIAWERKSSDQAIAQGRDPKLLEDDLWPDYVIEVQPDGPTGGKIVWQWHMWDHLVQDFDREKPNYGVIYEHPELIDVNNTGSTPPPTAEELRKLRAVGYTGGGDDDDDDDRRRGADWLHTNAIDYNAELDQIALSAKNFSEIWIIDHSTTTEEAASHRGGRSGKGGDLLYRWGNPWSYKSGTSQEKMLFDQHDVRWIRPGLPGSGHLMAFNNGSGRQYSSIIEIEPPLDGEGGYTLDDEGRYGPYELAWEYTAENKEDFYSGFISGATRQPNGNTLICEGAKGRVFEVNSEGKILWEFVNPYGGELTQDGGPNDVQAEARKIVDGGGQRSFVENNALFRATKYLPEYAAFAGQALEPLPEQPVPFASQVAEAVEQLKAEAAEKGDEAETDAGDDQTAESVDQQAASDDAREGEAAPDADPPADAPEPDAPEPDDGSEPQAGDPTGQTQSDPPSGDQDPDGGVQEDQQVPATPENGN
jgi:hypothetical protein